ncbi:MAG: hypothetical protein GX637_00185 [Clostridiales bacterium]|nr:hypothetical protein [Clostridiales bacterium]
MRLWVADGERGLMLTDAAGCRAVGPRGRLLCRHPGRIFCAGEGACFCCDEEGAPLLSFPIPSGACGMEAGRELVYLLSSDCDSLSAWSARTGEMVFSAPAGVYPRGLAMRPDGRCLAVAGGAAGEVWLFNERLETVQVYRVPGAAVGICFLSKGLAVLCAVGEEEGLSALLLRISPLGVVSELFRCPEAPLCLCREGMGCAAACHQKVYFLSEQGKVCRSLRCACPERLRRCGGLTLIADPWQGRVLLGNGAGVYAGGAPGDALLLRA